MEIMKMEKLTEAEEVTMKAVWDCHKEPVLSDVVDMLGRVYGKDWKPQTISTFLAKLVRKKYLRLQRNGKIYTYKILISEREYNMNHLRNIYYFLYASNEQNFKRDVEAIL